MSSAPGVHEVRLTDHRSHHSIRLGVDEYPGATGSWSLDTWITTDPAATAFSQVPDLLNRLTPEMRRTILRLKRELNATGRLRDGMSARIYHAVMEHGVVTIEELNAYPQA